MTTETDRLEIGGKRIFIDTGALPVIPPIPGIRESQRVYTSTSLLELDLLPETLVIIGGGYIGLEFASMFAAFGSKVTVLENATEFLSHEDRTIADREPVVYSVFIDPPLSRIGLTEQEAITKGYEAMTKTIPVETIPRSRISGNINGVLKSVVDAKNGKILGCTLFCIDSGEVINSVALAMKAGLDYSSLRDQIHTHPSMSESFNDLFSF